MVVRTDVYVTPQNQGGQRQPFHGSLDEIKSDIQATRDIGADELFIDPQGASAEGYLDVMEQFKDQISPGASGVALVENNLEVMEQMTDHISIGGGG